MSTHRPDEPHDEAEDIAAPSGDEQREAEWLAARDQHPDAPPPSPEVAREYATLESMLAGLPAEPEAPGWQDQLVASVMASARLDADSPAPRRAEPAPEVGRRADAAVAPRRRWRPAMLGALAFAAAAAAVVVAVMTRGPSLSEVAQLDWEVLHDGATRGSAEGSNHRARRASVGDRLAVTVTPLGPTELRVYAGEERVALRCPAEPACPAEAASWQVEVELRTLEPHYLVLVAGLVDAPASASREEFLAAARAGKLTVLTIESIDVH